MLCFKHFDFGTRWGSLIPRINHATAQLLVADQLLRRGKYPTVIWQRITKDKPRGTPLAIFQVL
jgi:hypothetical protein